MDSLHIGVAAHPNFEKCSPSIVCSHVTFLSMVLISSTVQSWLWGIEIGNERRPGERIGKRKL